MAQTEPEVHFTWLPSHLTLLPDHLPQTIPPPSPLSPSIAAPFPINKALYNAVLRPEVPIIFATIYVLSVLYLNAHNRRNNNAPWNISKTTIFKNFVIGHNTLLALYSFATFLALARAITHSFPAWNAENWPARAADSLCKLHGPRGLGDATTFNTTLDIWEVKNTAIRLTPRGTPDPTDVGRLWNEGLAFWGWWFYVSKFYEVLDTFIVLAKGKRSATLQTYHHAGAMLCMWAGIRFMSPPIWMFVFVNSGIHALMYTYYTASALDHRVPQSLKRTLTILQITQFVWGATYAALHLFVQYDIPISTPFQVVHAIERAVPSARSAVSSASSALTSVAETPLATAAIGDYLKKLLLRAAGEEGVAERLALRSPVLGQSGQSPLIPGMSPPSPQRLEQKVQKFIEHQYETRYHNDWSRINCIDTSGEAFAIYLNLLYLSPLTFLFVRFFIRAYTQRAEQEDRKRRARSASQVLHDAAEAVRKASNDTKQEVEGRGEQAEEVIDEEGKGVEDEVRNDIEKVIKELRSGSGLQAGKEKVKQAVESVEKKVEEVKGRISQEKGQGQGLNGTGAATGEQSQASTNNEESTSSTTESTQETTQESSFASKAKAERQSSSTWIKGGAGLFRRESSRQNNNDASTTTTANNNDDSSANKGEDAGAGDTEESEERQDENLEGTQDVRPEPEDGGGEGRDDEGMAESREDSDAMGRSGRIVSAQDVGGNS